MLQKQVAADLGIGNTNYNKLENGNREPSVKELQLLAKLFNMTTDQILNYDGELPTEITLQDKTAIEQLNLIAQLDEQDRTTVFNIIDAMLTKKKFADFFNEHLKQ